MDWLYNEYYPEDYGAYKTTIHCMTESIPKRDKYGLYKMIIRKVKAL